MDETGSGAPVIALDTEFANRKIWLVKVPNFVAEKWRGVCESNAHEAGEPIGPELGQITWAEGAPGGGEAQMQLNLTHPSAEGMPKSYTMNVATQNMTSMLAFAQSGERSVAAVGKVFQKFDVEVARRSGGASTSARDGADVLDPEYRALSRQRARAAATKSRTTQLISQPQITNLRQPVLIGNRKRDPTEKRLAKPAEELTADLFRLFERQAHWVFAQLQRQTEQPTQHLKAVLLEIAVQNKRGPYKDMWELKKGSASPGRAVPSPRAITIGVSVESLSYSVDMNKVGLRAMRRAAAAPRHLYGYSGRTLIKLLTTLASGVVIGLTAVALSESIEMMVTMRNRVLNDVLRAHPSPLPALALQLCVSVGFAVVAAAAVQLMAPKAAGAGVTLVMAHLNGNDIPDALTARTYAVKFFGNVAARVAGLALGPEGPMIHLGACVASCLCAAEDRLWNRATSRPPMRTRSVSVQSSSSLDGHLSPAIHRVASALTSARSLLSPGASYETLPGDPPAERREGLTIPLPGHATAPRRRLGFAAGTSGGDSTGTPLGPRRSLLAARLNQGSTPFFSNADHREMVSAGAAAGLAAAFGAPIGGVLFSLEEACSHWSRGVGWRCFLAATAASFTLSQLHPRGRSGILGFGTISAPDNRQWLLQLPFIALVSALGGLLGAGFNAARATLAGSRWKASRFNTGARLAESALVAAVTTLSVFAVSSAFGTCLEVPEEWDAELVVQYTCSAGQYNDLATILMATSVSVIRNMLGLGSAAQPVPPHCGLHRTCYYSLSSLCIAGGLYLCLMTLAASTASPGGLFMPSIMVGANCGAAAGLALHALLPPSFGIKPGIFAIVCATATLGGVFRSSISLVVIVVEGTRGIEFMFGIIVAVVISNAISQLLHRDGLYEGDLERDGTVFYLRQEPPHPLRFKTAADIMASPIVGLNQVEKVSRVLEVLRETTHSGFAVYDESSGRDPPLGSGRLAGLILRSQLMVLLRYRVYCDAAGQYLDSPAHPTLLEEWLATEMAARQAARRGSTALVQGGSRSDRLVERRTSDGARRDSGGTDTQGSGSILDEAYRLPSMLMDEGDAAELLAAVASQERTSHGRLLTAVMEGLVNTSADAPVLAEGGSAGVDALLGGRPPSTVGKPSDDEEEGGGGDDDEGPYLNLDPFMACAPLGVRTATPGTEVHRLFLALSLRHLPVVDRCGVVWGMITRKDLDRAAGRGWWRVNNPPATPELGSPLARRGQRNDSWLQAVTRPPRWLLAALRAEAAVRELHSSAPARGVGPVAVTLPADLEGGGPTLASPFDQRPVRR